MSVSDHIRIASTELMKAADLVKQEMNDLRRQKSDVQRDLENQIADEMRQMKQLEAIRRSTSDPQQTTQTQTTITKMQALIAQQQSELKTHQQNIENTLQEKSSLVSNLEVQARSITS